MGEQSSTPQRVAAELLNAVTQLRDRDCTDLSDEQTLELLRDIETAARMLTAIGIATLVEASDRGIPERVGAKTPKKLLTQALRLSHAEAGARVAAAKLLGTWHALDGSAREPELPHTAVALTEGAISAVHAREIAAMMKRIPALTPITDVQAAEEILADFARNGTPDDISTVGEAILARLDPDGTLTDDHDRQRMRGIIVGRQRADGMSPIRGDITPTLRALLDPLLAKHARPGMNNPDDPESPRSFGTNPVRGNGTRPGINNPDNPENPRNFGTNPVRDKGTRPGINNPDNPENPRNFGTNPARDKDIDSGVGNNANPSTDRDVLAAAARRDRRSAAQRTHDALLAILHPDNASAAGTPGDWGSHRGVPVSTILTVSVADVERAAGVATTATGGTVPMREALELAQNSQPFLAVFDHAGAPLHFGLAKRFATREQRMALIAAVRGCSRPGCDAPASLCAAHHIRDYAKGGPTDITNETLACDACHAMIHDGPGGWKTVVMDQSSEYAGRTGWIAPSHIDPSGTPKVNSRHHTGELLAAAVTRIHHRHEHRQRQHRQWLEKHPTSRSTAG
ncbi:HNH endonuclease signature motif containing protein [Nocardia callitridis]|uniref:HNH nuclease domain-containing protein n=1 Tax=Nocardia callitridis TaxID=648753 RepID=A0ABP9JUE5_9NOCA